MDCPTNEILLAYKAGRLDDETDSQLEEHMASCSSCRMVLVEWMRAERSKAQAETGDLRDRSANAETNSSVSTPLATATDETAQLRLTRGASVGRYLVLERLGAGGMGVVYAAYDPELDRKVALKLLRPREQSVTGDNEAQTRFRREAQAMAKVSHPNVVSVFDAQMTGGRVVIAMEFIGGGTLKDWMSEQQSSWREVLEKFQQACAGLAAVHDAGLVHRDFKPGNVLLRKDGRASVTDFGLVRNTGEEWHRVGDMGITDDGQAASSLSNVTRTGTVLGTPAYMAPEQIEGNEADARSDQFSFCVTLWEALYGARPFSGKTIEELKTNTLASEISPPPRDSGVPTAVHLAVVRGLNRAAENRHESMHELHLALTLDPVAKRRRRLGLVGLGVLLAGAIVGTYLLTRTPSSLCRSAPQELAGIWDGEVKERVEATFSASGRPYATDTFNRLKKQLNRWTKQWVNQHTEACEATHFKGVQSAKVLDLRMQCLGQKRENLRTLVNVFAEQPDVKIVDNAISAALALGDVAFCADVEALQQDLPPPEDPATRRAVEAIDKELERARQLDELGQYERAKDVLAGVTPRVEPLGYLPIKTKLALLEGKTHERFGKFEKAEEMLKEALQSGLQWNQTDLALETAQWLVYVVGYRMARHNEGLVYATTALGLSRDMGDEREARTLSLVGTILGELAIYEEAEKLCRQAAALHEAALGPEHPDVSNALNNLGRILEMQEKHDASEVVYRQALEVRVNGLGPRHSRVASLRNNLANALSNQGKLGEAEGEYRLAISIKEDVLGPEHPSVGRARNNLGVLLGRRGKNDEAEIELRRALELRANALGAEHPSVAKTKNALGAVLRNSGQFTEAELLLRQALEVRRNKFGTEHPSVAGSMSELGDLLRLTGRFSEAAGFYRKAFSICQSITCGPYGGSRVKFGLAQVLWRDGAKEQALELAIVARQGFDKSNRAIELADVDKWLAARGVQSPPADDS